ncbi:PAS domain-containing protein [Acidimangrovimonas sediminis]|uniref:PAS domain-containing protein n=1 Tax=Acidimangrovimonas sediminis TaxID=2056283 RepID=UPI000C7FAF77|nr:PAS domain-containing protein [Acidimangrovimonas sediminis]
MKDGLHGPDRGEAPAAVGLPLPGRTAAAPRPASGEAPFALDEIFYSRTDPRGVIRSGNDVFQRVAEYPWDRLVGAPHKVVRHPDMPRGVFHLLWQTIGQGRPIGAYVKNRAADGLHYWVFAGITPIEGGFLSVRIKPSAPLFTTIQAEYAALRAAEGDRERAPEDSAADLLERLRALGFPSYEAFMARALSDEIASRDAALGRPRDEMLPSAWRIAEELSRIEAEIAALVDGFRTVRLMPTNMRIAASRLEPAGGPITAISENYRLMAAEVTDSLAGFTREGRPLAQVWRGMVEQAAFRHGLARLQEECVGQTEMTEGEIGGGAFDEAVETGLLTRQMLDDRARAHQAIGEVIEAVGALPRLCSGLRRQIVGLDAVRRSCRVENSWLVGRGGGLASIIEKLDAFHGDTEGRLDRITEHANEIGARLRTLRRRSDDG